MASQAPQTEKFSATSNSIDTQSSEGVDQLSEDELELHLWQKAFFLDNGSSARHTADSLRLRLAHLRYCIAKQWDIVCL